MVLSMLSIGISQQCLEYGLLGAKFSRLGLANPFGEYGLSGVENFRLWLAKSVL